MKNSSMMKYIFPFLILLASCQSNVKKEVIQLKTRALTKEVHDLFLLSPAHPRSTDITRWSTRR